MRNSSRSSSSSRVAAEAVAVVAILALSGAALVACVDPPGGPDSPSPADEGGVATELQLDPGVSLGAVSYSITGPGAFTKTGSIDVHSSTKLTAVLSPIPAGVGFVIALDGTASDGVTSCVGGATFDVVAHQTTPVAIHLVCHEGARNGGVLLRGTINVCPTIDILSASPAALPVGGTTMLAGAAHDPDLMPSPISYAWTTDSGTLAGASTQNPTFTCTAPGVATLKLTASDGDATTGCADTATLLVSCTAP